MDIQMNQYYNFRKVVREYLYDNDALVGDLCCKVLEIRDKYRYIESITTAIQDYTIEVKLSEGTDMDKKTKVLEKIATVIGYYLCDHQDLLPAEVRNNPEFEIFLESENFIYCDIFMVGDSIKFNL